ncbi:hypothetical protein APR40_15005 [Salegentibacter salarius]|uniref:Uncharacterized protein n=1 Tax=Salegentibacter salarius TaxID=435906 RepID=A0A2N0TQE9_9FLAO|nr:hypothetical protein BHS39_15035 [Salegentibacter salarius]PKD16960.1 hypothetical protein APR40_15005 [Salegentibacter salarius]
MVRKNFKKRRFIGNCSFSREEKKLRVIKSISRKWRFFLAHLEVSAVGFEDVSQQNIKTML